MKPLLNTILIFTFSVLLANNVFAQSKVIAKFEGGQVTLAELEAAERGMAQQGADQEFIRRSYESIVREIARNKIFVSQGLKQKVDKDKLFQAKMEEYKNQLLASAFLDSQLAGKLNEEIVRKEYDKLVSDPKNREEIQVAHILVEKEADAKAIIADLNKGGNFAEIARSKSIDSASAKKGGDLGYISRNTMVAPFDSAAFALGNKETTKAPVKTRYGFHVIRKLDTRIKPIPKYEEVRDNIAKNLIIKLSQEVFEKYSKQLGLKVEPDPRIEQ